MQEQFWVALLRRIPASFHEGLIVATSTGADIVMQAVVRLEESFVILRGRPAGTNEVGRIIVLPYEQMNYISLPGRPTEQQVQAIFGDREAAFARLPDVLPPVTESPEPTAEVSDEPAQENGAPEQPSPDNAAATTDAAPQSAQPSRAQLLAKLRAKLTGGGPKSGPGSIANPKSFSN